MCQGALLRYSFIPNLLLFSNPNHKRKRKNLMLSVSKDNGKTWASEISICSKKSAYNDLVALPNGDLLCLFETGKILPYSGIYTAIIAQKLLSK
jgi:sialidase-1